MWTVNKKLKLYLGFQTG